MAVEEFRGVFRAVGEELSDATLAFVRCNLSALNGSVSRGARNFFCFFEFRN